jgi:short subunit dehydrogenase-like uncharacterized protein
MTQINKDAPTLLIYGATGFTGKLIAQEAVRRGIKFEIAGRDQAEVSAYAAQLNVPFHVFSVDDQEGWAKALAGKTSLLNVAGPFSATAEQAMNASITHKVNYIDISAEVDVYRLAESKDEAAKAAGIMILPGAGLFVSYDPLAVHTAKRVNSPVLLRAGYKYSGGFSPGSIASSANIINAGLLVRKNGELVKMDKADPAVFDSGNGPEEYLLTPFGGTVLSYKSTGIKDIEEYFQMALPASKPEGETVDAADAEFKDKSILVIEVTGDDGTVVRSKLEMDAGYGPTIFSSVEIVSRTLDGFLKVGFQSPASAYGEELLKALPNVAVTDL